MHVCVHMSTWSSEINIEYLNCFISTLFLKYNISLILKLVLIWPHCLASKSHESVYLCLLNAKNYRLGALYQIFTWMLGVQTQILILYRLKHLPSSYFYFNAETRPSTNNDLNISGSHSQTSLVLLLMASGKMSIS